MDDLLASIQLLAELAELRANPDRAAMGVVIEAKMDKSRGPLATVLVQTGTLRRSDMLVAGAAHGRVKALIDYRGQRIEKALPSMPVEVLGMSELPEAGDRVVVVTG